MSQVSSKNYKDATAAWLNQIDFHAVYGASEDFVIKLADSFDLPPTPLLGLENTWCLSGQVDGELALIHFTQTETDST